MTKTQFRKNTGFLNNISFHRKNAYWSKARANRWLKFSDNIPEPLSSLMLLRIYHFPKWYIDAWRDGNLQEAIQNNNLINK